MADATGNREVKPCPLGDHLVFTYKNGAIVPHYRQDGKPCSANLQLYASLMEARAMVNEAILPYPGRIYLGDADTAEQEAYQHGRTQGKLDAARAGLDEILKRAAKSKTPQMQAIAERARLALELSAK